MRSFGISGASPRTALRVRPTAVALCLGMLATGWGLGHGVVGKRFFPATLTIDDPFVADELSLPTYPQQKMPGSVMSQPRQTEWAFDYTKRITPDLGIGIGGTYLARAPTAATT